MREMSLDEKPEWKTVYSVNGYLLVGSFFLCRVIWFGFLVFKYTLPFLLYKMDYEEAMQSLGW